MTQLNNMKQECTTKRKNGHIGSLCGTVSCSRIQPHLTGFITDLKNTNQMPLMMSNQPLGIRRPWP